MNLRRKMKSRKTRIGIFVVLALQCRVEYPSAAFFIVFLCPSGKYSSETIEKLTFSYTLLYCEKQFRYLILVCMFPIASACAEFSCRPEIRRVALLPVLYSVIVTRRNGDSIPPINHSSVFCRLKFFGVDTAKATPHTCYRNYERQITN